MYYTVYKITNLINGKIYVGVHKTNNLNDGYMGSGKYLNCAFAKHGIENFKKEILFVFDNPKEMFAKEAEIVNKDFLAEGNTYNLRLGGFGGFDYINASGLNTQWKDPLARSASIRKSVRDYLRQNPKIVQQMRERLTINLDKATHMRNKKYPEGTFKNKRHSEETKLKIGAVTSNFQRGEGNSQYGTMWITDGTNNCKIKREDTIPQGWRKGRVVRNRAV